MNKEELCLAQQQVAVLNQVLVALQTPSVNHKNTLWREQPLLRYRQIWSQLILVDGVACRKYKPGPREEAIEVALIPKTLCNQVMHHDGLSAGHQGVENILARLHQEAFWVNMACEVDEYCRKCIICQCSKMPMPIRAPMLHVPIGRTWQMIAVDILEVPVSTYNNRYLMVVQDYFSKWAEAIHCGIRQLQASRMPW